MGQYRLSIYIIWQIGLLISYDKHTGIIGIKIPFMSIFVATVKEAKGTNIFK